MNTGKYTAENLGSELVVPDIIGIAIHNRAMLMDKGIYFFLEFQKNSPIKIKKYDKSYRWFKIFASFLQSTNDKKNPDKGFISKLNCLKYF